MSAFAGLGRILKPVTLTQEMEKPARFCADITWTGIVEAGGMTPGARRQPPVVGDARTHPGQPLNLRDLRTEPLLDATFVLTWQLHWVIARARHPATTGSRSRTTASTPAS